MATPIAFLKIQTDSVILDVPIYNITDVLDSSFRIMTSNGLGCFDLVAPTNETLRVMTQTGIKGINLASVTNDPINEDFLDDVYNFAITHGSPTFARFSGTSPNGNLGYIKSTNQGIDNSICSISFELNVPIGMVGQVEVDYVVDSELDYDFLRFFLNENLQASFSGANVIGTAIIPLTEGTNDLKIVYQKDAGEHSFTDSVYISEIRLIKG